MHQLDQTLLALLGIGAAALLAGHASAGEILVDSFDETFQQVQLPTLAADQAVNLPQDVSDSDREYAPGALGDDRALSILATAVPNSANAQANVNAPSKLGLLSISRTAGITGMITTVVWDGGEDISGNPLGLTQDSNFDGDITGDGDNDGLLVGLLDPVSDAFDLALKLTGGSAASLQEATSFIQVAVGHSGDLFFPFLGFSGASDLTDLLDNLFSIEMIISEPAVVTNSVISQVSVNTPFSLLIDFVKATNDPNDSTTPLALPATLPLLIVGLAGLRFAGRRRSLTPC